MFIYGNLHELSCFILVLYCFLLGGGNISKDLSLHEKMTMPNPHFAVKLTSYSSNEYGSEIFENHWHEQIEILYFKSGSALIECNSNPIYVKTGDLIIINSNDLHRGICLSKNLNYYCIILDTSILYSKTIDICDTKYITPIVQNYIVFKNKISDDKAVNECIDTFIKEYNEKALGFELALKFCLYKFFTLLLRNYSAYTMNSLQHNKRTKNLEIFNPILQHIESHFNEDLTISMLSRMANISKYYFCHSFKGLTGKTFTEYLNIIRINKSELMLKSTDMNVTEVATACGYNDLNYFSRLYKKYKGVPPSKIKQEMQDIEERP